MGVPWYFHRPRLWEKDCATTLARLWDVWGLYRGLHERPLEEGETWEDREEALLVFWCDEWLDLFNLLEAAWRKGCGWEDARRLLEEALTYPPFLRDVEYWPGWVEGFFLHAEAHGKEVALEARANLLVHMGKQAPHLTALRFPKGVEPPPPNPPLEHLEAFWRRLEEQTPAQEEAAVFYVGLAALLGLYLHPEEAEAALALGREVAVKRWPWPLPPSFRVWLEGEGRLLYPYHPLLVARRRAAFVWEYLAQGKPARGLWKRPFQDLLPPLVAAARTHPRGAGEVARAFLAQGEEVRAGFLREGREEEAALLERLLEPFASLAALEGGP
ncbi:hypothetical protein QT17_08710 [Thermus sp. 2.9]|uniref:hypothetical protein n=1 Tax=Thermus sp. (strain 2.9) TaxID=1577051 RepID=UPI000544143F|nr:hypothetical protein [Thermus sp. 2.9]KHG64969.1 hypothetical protein QT17_08710 [Thermus sp. 2.9]